MRRSQINQAIDEALAFFKKRKFPLPSFAFWTPEQWDQRRSEAQEIINNKLGWDVTDFGLGDFDRFGRTIITLRNGLDRTIKSYCQKVMFLKEEQKSPLHFHKIKTEDVINQGGGNILVRFDNSAYGSKKITVSVDGLIKIVTPNKLIKLRPGESICIRPGLIHQFWAEKGAGPVLLMEISSVNNDLTDNYWLDPVKRYPKIIEDEPRRYLLCNEYL